MTEATDTPSSPKPGRRIAALDAARGVALIAMAVYHFTWDLDHFGYVARGLATTGGWKIFARSIASSFLLLVGIGLVLAHARGIRWRPFLRRLAEVAVGAVAITVVTIFATPESYVFFGILHHIALASLLGLAAVRLPWFATALLAALTIALPFFVQTPLTEPKALAWIGFAAKAPVTNDFVPLFPWFGAVLAGMALAQLGLQSGVLERLRAADPASARLRPLVFLGRHSLLFYLVHQPLLFGLVLLATQIVPPDRAAILEESCRQECAAERGAEACNRFCACARTELEAADLLKQLLDGTTTPEEDDKVREVVGLCSMRP